MPPSTSEVTGSRAVEPHGVGGIEAGRALADRAKDVVGDRRRDQPEARLGLLRAARPTTPAYATRGTRAI
ncbi:hypothetical protein CF640_37795 [Burkholderia pseudomallei]|nr:hypothetical protein CF640_37795 [Burkholderia pseudomallei]